MRNLSIQVFNKSFFVRAVVLLIAFYFFFVIKSFNYDRYPLMGHLEEYAYAWMGQHLIETGVPQTWSPADKFHSQDNSFSGSIKDYGVELNVDILGPWLDLPPLYGLLSGGVAYLYGDDRWSVVPASHIRLPAMIFAFATTIVLFLLTKKLFGFWMAIFAGTIYSLTPVFVFGQRISVSENGLAFLYLSVIYLTLLYTEKRRWYLIFAIPILIGLAGLMKQTGFLISFFSVFLLVRNNLWREAIFVFLGSLYFVGVLLGYGYSVDWELFQRINLQQSSRPVGFSGLPFIFSSPGFSLDFFFDGWYIFSILSIFYLAVAKFNDSRYQLISLAFVFWAMVVVFSAGQTDILLWYHYPLFPYLAIAAALMIAEIIKKPTLITTIIVVGMLLSGRTFLSNEFRSMTEPFKFRLIIAFLVLPAILHTLFKKEAFEKINQAVLIGVVAVGLYLNAQAIYSAYPIASASKSFPMGPGTFLSEVHLPLVWRFFLVE